MHGTRLNTLNTLNYLIFPMGEGTNITHILDMKKLTD